MAGLLFYMLGGCVGIHRLLLLGGCYVVYMLFQMVARVLCMVEMWLLGGYILVQFKRGHNKSL